MNPNCPKCKGTGKKPVHLLTSIVYDPCPCTYSTHSTQSTQTPTKNSPQTLNQQNSSLNITSSLTNSGGISPNNKNVFPFYAGDPSLNRSICAASAPTAVLCDTNTELQNTIQNFKQYLNTKQPALPLSNYYLGLSKPADLNSYKDWLNDCKLNLPSILFSTKNYLLSTIYPNLIVLSKIGTQTPIFDVQSPPTTKNTQKVTPNTTPARLAPQNPLITNGIICGAGAGIYQFLANKPDDIIQAICAHLSRPITIAILCDDITTKNDLLNRFQSARHQHNLPTQTTTFDLNSTQADFPNFFAWLLGTDTCEPYALFTTKDNLQNYICLGKIGERNDNYTIIDVQTNP